MEYMSALEAARIWGFSEGAVNRYCAEGFIENAVRLGNGWAVPMHTPKPEDMRKRYGEAKLVRVAMPLLNTVYKPGHCMEVLESIQDPDSKNIALAEYCYFSGQPERASDLAEGYLTHGDLALRVSAAWIYVYANLSLNRIPQARKVLSFMQNIQKTVTEETPAADRALTVCVSAAACTLLHLPVPEALPPMRQFIYLLPPGLRLFALYVQAHNEYLNQRYGASIGIVETALALEGDVYPIAAVYLHMVATMDYMSLKQVDQAREHLLAAWVLAKPDNLIEPFGEHHGLLGGMLEAVIKKEWPEDFRRIIAITYNFSSGWRKIHNLDTGHDVADDLTTTEFSIAMLAARNWSNKDIGVHLGISANTVKQHISSALQKLGITQRKELARFMLK